MNSVGPGRGSLNPRRLPIPKLIDLAGYDGSFWRKQPDWTYAS